jgi:hypothetical protein
MIAAFSGGIYPSPTFVLCDKLQFTIITPYYTGKRAYLQAKLACSQIGAEVLTKSSLQIPKIGYNGLKAKLSKIRR